MNESRAVGAWGDDDGASNAGAVYVLLLHGDGTLKAYSKISNNGGGLSNVLPVNGRFGSAVTALGDADGDGNLDLLVGAYGNSDAGAVYCVFLRKEGSAKGSNMWTLDAALADDGFGIAIGNVWGGFGPESSGLGGTVRVAVGASGDDDEKPDSGAVYIVDLLVEDLRTPAPTVTAVNARVTVGDWWKFSNDAGELPFTIGRESPKNCSPRADDCRRLLSDI